LRRVKATFGPEMSAFGPKRIHCVALRMSAFETKADTLSS